MDWSQRMTALGCLNYCSRLGFTGAGVEAGKECFCGNQLHSSHIRPSSECNSRCSGNSNEFCGGSWRINVYQFGKRKNNS